LERRPRAAITLKNRIHRRVQPNRRRERRRLSAPHPKSGLRFSSTTFAEAEKLVNVQLTGAERAAAAGNWCKSMAPLYERRLGPRKLSIESEVAPYSRWDPILPGEKAIAQRDEFIWSNAVPAAPNCG
jgi:hypothetical protein